MGRVWQKHHIVALGGVKTSVGVFMYVTFSEKLVRGGQVRKGEGGSKPNHQTESQGGRGVKQNHTHWTEVGGTNEDKERNICKTLFSKGNLQVCNEGTKLDEWNNILSYISLILGMKGQHNINIWKLRKVISFQNIQYVVSFVETLFCDIFPNEQCTTSLFIILNHKFRNFYLCVY